MESWKKISCCETKRLFNQYTVTANFNIQTLTVNYYRFQFVSLHFCIIVKLSHSRWFFFFFLNYFPVTNYRKMYTLITFFNDYYYQWSLRLPFKISYFLNFHKHTTITLYSFSLTLILNFQWVRTFSFLFTYVNNIWRREGRKDVKNQDKKFSYYYIGCLLYRHMNLNHKPA